MSASMSKADPAPIFAALGDPTRLSLVIKLSTGGSRSIASLAIGSGLTRQAVTKHLRVLEGAGLVSAERVGRESRFALCPDPLMSASAYLVHVSLQWDSALDRLKDHIERS